MLFAIQLATSMVKIVSLDIMIQGKIKLKVTFAIYLAQHSKTYLAILKNHVINIRKTEKESCSIWLIDLVI